MNEFKNQSWFCDPASQKVMEVLAKNRQEARFVGGCVRDSLCGRLVHDIDVATPERPETVLFLLEKNDIKAIPTGIDHGTITAICNGQQFEITTLRSDVSTDGRRATVAFTDDWLEDAKRRDFTFNALSVDRHGQLFDPFDGQKDLAQGRVRFVGNAQERIKEDYLRLLRFFRFHAYYGKGNPQADALQACRDLAEGLKSLSGERITQEMLKLLVAPHPEKWIRLMKDQGILSYLIPVSEDVQALEMMCALEDKPDPLRRLAVLLPADKDAVDQLAKRWHLSNKQKKRLQLARCTSDQLLPTDTREKLRSFLYRYGPVAACDQLLIYWAHKQLSGLGPKEQSILAEIEDWETKPQTFPLTGKDLLARGVSPGPYLGQVLKQVEDWWCETGCQADKNACLSYFNKLD